MRGGRDDDEPPSQTAVADRPADDAGASAPVLPPLPPADLQTQPVRPVRDWVADHPARLWAADHLSILAAIAGALVLIAAVSSVVALRRPATSQPASQVAPPAPTVQAPTAPAAPAVDPVDAAVMQAYRDSVAVFVRASTANPPNDADPGIAATTYGAQRLSLVGHLILLREDGLVARGTIQNVSVRVVDRTAATAHIVACDYATALLYHANGQLATPFPGTGAQSAPGYDTTRATLVLVNGHWLVSQATVTTSCDGR